MIPIYTNDRGGRSNSPGPVCRALALLGLCLSTAPALADGVVQFADTQLAVKEGERETLTIVRSGSLTGSVSVLLAVAPITAGLDDFTVDPLGVIQIEDGASFAHVDVTAESDDNVEGTEFATLTLTERSGASLGAAATLNLDILDDDSAPTELSFATQGILRITEGDKQDVEVSRSGEEGAAEIDVDGNSGRGNATIDVDYEDPRQTLQFEEREQNRNFSLSALNDDEPEGTEFFTLLLENGQPDERVVPGGRSRLVLIEDNDIQPGEFDIEVVGDASIGEDAGSVQLQVNRERGSTGLVTVDYVTADGTDDSPAVADTDYEAATGTLVFGEGELSVTFDVTILDDPDKRGDQREFDVYIANPGNLANLDPDRLGVTITINEDDGSSSSDCDFFCNDICFIATAAYGSKMDPHVVSLRRFRDEVLLRTGPGRAFVAAYYRYSPPLAAYIAERDTLRAAVRATLWPVVFTVEHPVGTLGLLSATLLGLNLRRRRRRPGTSDRPSSS